MPSRRLRCGPTAAQRGAGLALFAALLGAASAQAASELMVDYPDAFGVVPAATYDVKRERVGKAHLVLEELEEGRVRMFSESGFTAGPRTIMKAVLERADGQRKLRPIHQESRSFDAEGNAMGVLAIDHANGIATCTSAEGERLSEVELPDGDRVANVTLNLLFLPLVRRDAKEIAFQIFLCGGGAKLVDFVANLSPESRNGKGAPALEVRYGPDFGIASMVARRFVPKLSVWFDPQTPHPWLAHRVPLYGKGPEVFVIRDGVPPRWLGED